MNHATNDISNLRLDDFDFYFPRANRNNYQNYLPIDRWRNGAFIIRYSSKKAAQATFCITVIYSKDNQPKSPREHVRHILINIADVTDSLTGEIKKEFYINKPEEMDCKFSSHVELITYYMRNSLKPHFNELDTCLVDVFSDDTNQILKNLAPSQSVSSEVTYADPNVTDLRVDSIFLL